MGTEATSDKAKFKRGKAAPKQAVPLPPNCEAFVGKAQICFALGVSLRTFATMRSSGEFPDPDAHLGNLPRWRVETLNRWIRRRSGVEEG